MEFKSEKINKLKIFFSTLDRMKQWNSDPVKPLYNGHHWDLKIVSVIERCPLRRGSSQAGLFCFKNLL